MELDTESFEWELSKENVTQLRGGRSVTLLNKVLSSQNSHEFQLKRLQLRQHFELKLASMPQSFAKLRLYSRYLRWIEQTYPSVRRSPDLENVLYRCVRDSGQLPNVHNDDDFVDVWIRLTDYCDQPAELFELLFRQGIGTMCAKFYTTWAELLESRHQIARAAAVYAHGLRACAQPLFVLEDRAELFITRYQAECTAQNLDRLTADILTLPPPQTDSRIRSGEVSTRQALAALRLTDTDTSSVKVPVIRTSDRWHPDQKGLGPASNVLAQTPSLQSRPRLVPHSNSDQDRSSVATLLHIVPPLSRSTASAPSGASTRPFGPPTEWQKENLPKAGPWVNEKLPNTSSQLPQPSTQSWQFYAEPEQGNGSDSTPSARFPEKPSNTTDGKATAVKRKGLMALHTSSGEVSGPTLKLSTFHTIFGNEPSHGTVTSSVSASGDDVYCEAVQLLNLPSLPPGHLPKDAIFSIPLDLIYGGAEEICWEMHRAMRLDNFWPSFKSETQNGTSQDWDEEEQHILQEIESITEQQEEDTGSKLFQSEQANIGPNRVSLIKALETMALR
ncbi:Mitotic checkpoint serine/threonine-protein kinase BUB1 beta [Clonorchis sinensis]|uniref:Mitotic checkpoint serine/threonine-protein kinase BUB1 beta n=1 Tax=Clonorchis sinensis TaxID=79923 RepID=A0A8T1LYZ6_CLOSI|nr:Mitotic checkpoint serine/threonine-protein kinase BUB1 beta [Clonorchis sinensis]